VLPAIENADSFLGECRKIHLRIGPPGWLESEALEVQETFDHLGKASRFRGNETRDALPFGWCEVEFGEELRQSAERRERCLQFMRHGATGRAFLSETIGRTSQQ
jgi:hypothetical protein